VRELSLHVLDIAQNSLEAGATHVGIQVTEDLSDDLFTICIADDGRGMSADLVRGVLDPFVTTRTTRRVGLGLPLLEAAARRCGGTVSVYSRPGRGTRITATFQHSHIDRAPLSDMATTLLTLIVANPRVRFRYRHQVESWRFELDTARLKEILGDVPFSAPAVVQWLKDYLAGDTPPESVTRQGNCDKTQELEGEGAWQR
jgi:hypothetical protein